MFTKNLKGELTYNNDIHAVVEVGLLIDQEATFDEQGNLLTEPTYREGYHFDIMSNNEIDFGANRNFIKKWKADLRYIKNMERNGKGIRVFRLLLLTIIGIIFVPYCFMKYKIIK